MDNLHSGALDRHFLVIVAVLLAILAAAQIGSAIQDSATNDEAIHLTSGYVYLTTGEYGMDLSHPPLGRVLAALPLLTLPLKRIPADKAWLNLGTLIRDNPVPPSTVLMYARLMVIALTFLFGAWLSCWTRRNFGSPVALLALTFFAFDPNIAAHGHYVTTDLIASFGIFLACTLWTDFLQEPSSKALLLAVGALGLALVSKFSALFLLLVLPLLYAIAWQRKRGQSFFTPRGSVRVLLFTIAGVGLSIALAYGPATIARANSSRAVRGPIPPSSEATLQKVASLRSVRRVFSELRSATKPDSFRYIQGVNELRRHNSEGNPAYLLGKFSRWGWWQYFPVAFLVKTPTGVLLACLIAAASLFYFRRETILILPLACIVLTPATYFLLAMHSSIDVGIRHILPVYPFLYVLISFLLIRYARSLLRWTFPYVIATLIILTAIESLSRYPHYLAFFNWPSGGPANGSRYLLDSNLDWGQDSDNLKRYVARTGGSPLCTAIFGAPRGYFGADSRDIFATAMPENIDNLNCVAAVSVNFVTGLYIGTEKFASLRRRKPFVKIGDSIYLYDLLHRDAASQRDGHYEPRR